MLQITEDLDMQHDTGVESTSRWIEKFKVASEHVLQSGKKIQMSKKNLKQLDIQMFMEIGLVLHPGLKKIVLNIMHFCIFAFLEY